MKHGVVAGGSDGAAEAGAEILRAGGNACDAAVAALLVAFQSEPLISSAAGGGVFLGGNATDGFACCEFIPAMPGLGLGARPALDFAPITIDFGAAKQVFHVGRGAAAVPAGLAGLHAAHRRWGRLPLVDVVAPAVRAASEGSPVTEMGAKLIGLIEPIWRRSPEMASLYAIDGRPAKRGDRLRNPGFAAALGTFAREGLGPFYEGDIADRAVAAFGAHAGGLLTKEDLAAYRPAFRAPLRIPLWGGELLTAPPRSMGGALVALALAAVEARGLAAGDFLGERHVHAVIDAEILSLELRDRVDPDGPWGPAAVEELLSEKGRKTIAARLGRASPHDATDARAPKGGTTHVSVLDAEGNVATVTMSHGEGCGHLIPGTGIAMNNFLGEEDINPRGFHALPAGSPLTTMMAPTVFLREGRPEVVLGSGGANRLRTALFQVVLNHVGLAQPLDVAVEAPRVHVEPGAFYAEPFDRARPVLERRAAEFASRVFFPEPNLFFGGVNAVAVENGRLVGAADSRRSGTWVSC